MVALKQVLTEILACFQFLPLSFTAITEARRENIVEEMGCESNSPAANLAYFSSKNVTIIISQSPLNYLVSIFCRYLQDDCDVDVLVR